MYNVKSERSKGKRYEDRDGLKREDRNARGEGEGEAGLYDDREPKDKGRLVEYVCILPLGVRNGKERAERCSDRLALNDMWPADFHCSPRAVLRMLIARVALLSPYRASRLGKLDAPLLNGLSTRKLPDANGRPGLVLVEVSRGRRGKQIAGHLIW
jgi:hypothetical protein